MVWRAFLSKRHGVQMQAILRFQGWALCWNGLPNKKREQVHIHDWMGGLVFWTQLG